MATNDEREFKDIELGLGSHQTGSSSKDSNKSPNTRNPPECPASTQRPEDTIWTVGSSLTVVSRASNQQDRPFVTFLSNIIIYIYFFLHMHPFPVSPPIIFFQNLNSYYYESLKKALRFPGATFFFLQNCSNHTISECTWN